jgi:hypothetical protein
MLMQNPEMAQMGQQDPQQFEIMFEAEVAKVAAQITQELVQTEKLIQKKEDPLIKIKQQEIDLRAMDLQRKAEETKFRAEQENQRACSRLEFDYDRLAQQDEQSDERLEVAREKIDSKKK